MSESFMTSDGQANPRNCGACGHSIDQHFRGEYTPKVTRVSFVCFHAGCECKAWVSAAGGGSEAVDP
jgi:hypothetical protein